MDAVNPARRNMKGKWCGKVLLEIFRWKMLVPAWLDSMVGREEFPRCNECGRENVFAVLALITVCLWLDYDDVRVIIRYELICKQQCNCKSKF